MNQVIIERFWSRVKKTDSCWLWTGYIDMDGYGQFYVRPKQVNGDSLQIGAHRFSYELHREPIPAKMQIDHLCRVRNCVNPEHLAVVTNVLNSLRGKEHTKPYCKRGHARTLENLTPDGHWCRICRRAASKAYYHKLHPLAHYNKPRAASHGDSSPKW